MKPTENKARARTTRTTELTSHDDLTLDVLAQFVRDATDQGWSGDAVVTMRSVHPDRPGEMPQHTLTIRETR